MVIVVEQRTVGGDVCFITMIHLQRESLQFSFTLFLARKILFIHEIYSFGRKRQRRRRRRQQQ